ncbi:hypothetical protein L208DRAFT_1389469 [Tricholoma matsutake]|nr:hypothetical protein L208DRAFT_1389469 [Tricholoma matsutake 945]
MAPTVGHGPNILTGNQDRGISPPLAPGQSPVTDEDLFRASLISKMDDLVDFRKEKASRMETLYQILQILHNAKLDEPARKAILEEYTLYHHRSPTERS